eukprot:2456168-Prymnesium_polylepis.1
MRTAGAWLRDGRVIDLHVGSRLLLACVGRAIVGGVRVMRAATRQCCSWCRSPRGAFAAEAPRVASAVGAASLVGARGAASRAKRPDPPRG